MLTIRNSVTNSETSSKEYPEGGGLDYVNNYRHYRLIAHFAGLLLYLGYSGRNVIVNVSKIGTNLADRLLGCNFRCEQGRNTQSENRKARRKQQLLRDRARRQKMKRWVMDKMEGVCLRS